ncbi:hypothetical protein [Phytoactinopolyspora halotolerans]|uniref:CpsD/CapB family tyrosine-protein kinase n=1 Tax=Phytoactinopolyspora halotolerans TaxID=1981512 RepID=A0A6L9S809_9ACTN|nr:hypothetical protein [Phytoactinopolyspora halotolerans]NEE01177.1 hypothetical protein [Phytoactinopolyspora halotolerans]
MTSTRGAPGVTTSALALTLMWPRSAILVEADVSGSSSIKAGHFRGQLGARPNIGQLVVAHRGGNLDIDTLLEAGIVFPLNPDRRFVPGMATAAQREDLTTGFWMGLAQALTAMTRRDGVDVIIDAGRLGMTNAPTPLLDAADLIAVVSRTRLDDAVSVTANAALLRGATDVAVDHVGLVLVGEGRPVRGQFFTERTGLPVWASLAFDPATAEQLCGGQEVRSARKLELSPLMRSVRSAITELEVVAARRRELLGRAPSTAGRGVRRK